MRIEYFDVEKHYPHLLMWWFDRDYPSVPISLLPRAGLVVETENGDPICAGFLYATDGNTAQIAHLVSDKGMRQEIRSPALDLLIMALEKIAISGGFEMVTGATNLPQLIQRYRKLGFKCYDEGVTHVGKELRKCQ